MFSQICFFAILSQFPSQLSFCFPFPLSCFPYAPLYYSPGLPLSCPLRSLSTNATSCSKWRRPLKNTTDDYIFLFSLGLTIIRKKYIAMAFRIVQKWKQRGTHSKGKEKIQKKKSSSLIAMYFIFGGFHGIKSLCLFSQEQHCQECPSQQCQSGLCFICKF